jgi:hypothetical protein
VARRRCRPMSFRNWWMPRPFRGDNPVPGQPKQLAGRPASILAGPAADGSRPCDRLRWAAVTGRVWMPPLPAAPA